MGLLICDIPGSCINRVECENRSDDMQIIQMEVCTEAGEQVFCAETDTLIQVYKEIKQCAE